MVYQNRFIFQVELRLIQGYSKNIRIIILQL